MPEHGEERVWRAANPDTDADTMKFCDNCGTWIVGTKGGDLQERFDEHVDGDRCRELAETRETRERAFGQAVGKLNKALNRGEA